MKKALPLLLLLAACRQEHSKHHHRNVGYQKPIGYIIAGKQMLKLFYTCDSGELVDIVTTVDSLEYYQRIMQSSPIYNYH
jgi:hypothetical protein